MITKVLISSEVVYPEGSQRSAWYTVEGGYQLEEIRGNLVINHERADEVLLIPWQGGVKVAFWKDPPKTVEVTEPPKEQEESWKKKGKKRP